MSHAFGGAHPNQTWKLGGRGAKFRMSHIEPGPFFRLGKPQCLVVLASLNKGILPTMALNSGGWPTNKGKRP